MDTTNDICQSCAMPLTSQEFKGTNKDNSKNEEYCKFCFQDGEFTFKGTFEEFIKKQIEIAKTKLDMSEEKASEMANNMLPKLKRWSRK